jgi:hypothetical protein
MNYVTGHLRFVDECSTFKQFLKDRLERLWEGWEDIPSVREKLLKEVKGMVYPEVGEGCYATLAAWDLLEPWSRFTYGTMMLAMDDENHGEQLGMLMELLGFDADWLADETRHMVLKQFAEMAPKEDSGVVVLVRAPWTSEKNMPFRHADIAYYRKLAYNTFVEPLEDGTPMSELSEVYVGDETIGEVSRRIEGIVIIDEMVKPGKVLVHAFYNANNVNADSEKTKNSLKDVVEYGDERGIYEEIENDND